MLSRSLKMAFWVTYDHLGKLMLANVVCFVLVIVPIMVGLAGVMTGDPNVILTIAAPLLFAAITITLPVTAVGLAYMNKRLIEERDGSLSDLFRGMGLYWKPAVGVGFLGLLPAVCLPVSIWFYATHVSIPWLGYAISAFALWSMLFLALVWMFVFPAVVQKNAGAADGIKTAALLVLDNPALSLGLGVHLALWGLVSVMPLVTVLLSGSVAAVLVSSGYEMLSRKYEAIRLSHNLEERPARPIHVVYRNGKLEWDDASDEYLNRGLRDMLFPWKG